VESLPENHPARLNKAYSLTSLPPEFYQQQQAGGRGGGRKDDKATRDKKTVARLKKITGYKK
jgi:hypothetical protein